MRPVSHLRFLWLSALSVAVACGDTTVVLLPGEPMTVVVLPYNPEAIRDSLSKVYGTPAPTFPELEAAFRAWQAPELSDSGPVFVAWRATRDSVQRLADSLRARDRRSEGYGAAYGRFRALYQRFAERTAARDALYRGATARARELALAAGQAADSLRRWEAVAWAGFDSAAALAYTAAGRDSVVLVALDGEPLALTLPAGHWWIAARTRVDGNPFLEHHWYLGLVAAGFGFRLPLDHRTAQTHWRH